MKITVETLESFGATCAGLDTFVELHPDGLDISRLWGTKDERSALWREVLESPLKRHVGWAILEGVIPARIEAYLRGANLRGADLRGANLKWANLSEANLRGANLKWANLSEANLRGANLKWAYLRGANLRGADLRGAYLSGADLAEANLRWAISDDATICLEGCER